MSPVVHDHRDQDDREGFQALIFWAPWPPAKEELCENVIWLVILFFLEKTIATWLTPAHPDKRQPRPSAWIRDQEDG
jgi:hypothetical protein